MNPTKSKLILNIQHNYAQPVDIFLIMDEQDQINMKYQSSTQ